MRKTISLILAMSMVLSMTACNTGTSLESTVASEQTVTATGELATIVAIEEPAADAPETKENKPYIEIPEELRAYDAAGNQVRIDHSGTGTNGMVTSERYEASEIGVRILKEGGNAFDAAVATAFALTVCDPYMSGLGGGGLCTLYDARTGDTAFINFRESTPMYMAPEVWVEDSEGNVIGNQKKYGGKAVGIPGEISGLLYILDKYGTMTREEVIRPSVELARQGYVVTHSFINTMDNIYKLCTSNVELSGIYLDKNGLIPEVGTVIRNEPMAKALEAVIADGTGALSGELGRAMVEAVQKSGGVMVNQDLTDYKVTVMDTIKGNYKGYDIYTANSPSSGGIFMLEQLNIQENFPVYDWNSIERVHLLTEIQKMTYADRGKWMGDTSYVDVPLDGLTSKEYAASLAKKIDMSATQEYTYDDPWSYNHFNTTGFLAADKDGNMAALTHSLNSLWGSQVYVEGYGLFMNNTLDDYNTGTDSANSLEPGKFSMSSMTPTLIYKDGKPFMAVSASGGYTILSAVQQVITAAIDYGMTADEAINNAPRILDAGLGETTIYGEWKEGVLKELDGLGHAKQNRSFVGIPEAIIFHEDGTMEGSYNATLTGGDILNDGCAVGY